MIAYSTISAKWRLPSRYYKKSFADLVDVFVLDTEKLDIKQVSWVKKELKQSKAVWKIVVGHHPLIAYDAQHGNARGE